MIIPPRCFTCGTVIGNKWKPFLETVLEEKQKSNETLRVDQVLDAPCSGAGRSAV